KVLPRTISLALVRVRVQAWVTAVPAGSVQVAPPSPVRSTAGLLRLVAQPEPESRRYTAEIGASIGWWAKVQVTPPSPLRRRKPPPPAMVTSRFDVKRTAERSPCVERPRPTGVHTAPPFTLSSAVAKSPTTHTGPPSRTSTAR